MVKPLSYSSVFVSIRQPLVLSTDNASFKAKNMQAGSPDLFISMNRVGIAGRFQANARDKLRLANGRQIQDPDEKSCSYWLLRDSSKAQNLLTTRQKKA